MHAREIIEAADFAASAVSQNEACTIRYFERKAITAVFFVRQRATSSDKRMERTIRDPLLVYRKFDF